MNRMGEHAGGNGSDAVMDLARLREALSECDPATRDFLAPIISLQSVQQVLLTFLHDHSKSFDEWVWDPNVRTILSRLRDQNPMDHHQEANVDRWFQQAQQDQLETYWQHQQQAAFLPWSSSVVHGSDQVSTSGALTNTGVDTATNDDQQDTQDWFQLQQIQVIQLVEEMREDGKRKFQKANYYPALNAYKRCLTALQKHHQDPLTQQSIPIQDWHEDLKQLYVTCCCNVAICALKLKDLSGIREYSHKALEVDPTCCKALYSLAKLHMMEHLYEEAYAIVDRALQMHPKNHQLMKFRQEIGQNEMELHQREEEFAVEVEKYRHKAEELQRKEQYKQQAYEQAYERKLQTLEKETPLPDLCQTDSLASARLHTYMTRIKHNLVDEYTQLFNPDKGEQPRFSCDMIDAATRTKLAEGVEASSKKVAKNLAARIAIKKLWEMQYDQGLLSPEDKLKYENLKNDIEDAQIQPQQLTGQNAAASTTEAAASEPVKVTYPLRISHHELLLDSVQLLNQLTAQKKIDVRYDFEDLSPVSGVTTEYRCIAFLNGTQAATASAISKKKARAIVAKETFQKAIQTGILKLPPKNRSKPKYDHPHPQGRKAPTVVPPEEE